LPIAPRKLRDERAPHLCLRRSADAAIIANRMTVRWTFYVLPVMLAAGSPMGLSRLRFAGSGSPWRVAAFIRPCNNAHFT